MPTPYLKHIKPFLTHLGEHYPQLDSFAGLTRAMIEPALNHSLLDRSNRSATSYQRVPTSKDGGCA